MNYLQAEADIGFAATALKAALANASVENPYRATVESLALSTWDDSATAGGAGSYQGDDIALFEMLAADGSMFRYVVPCPSPDLFYPDEATIDPDASASAAIIDFLLTYCASATGSPLVTYQRGWRSGVPPL